MPTIKAMSKDDFFISALGIGACLAIKLTNANSLLFFLRLNFRCLNRHYQPLHRLNPEEAGLFAD